MTNEARALLIVAALLSGASGSAGFVGGRMSAAIPAPEVRTVVIPAPAPAAVHVEAEPAPVEPSPPVVTAPDTETRPDPPVSAAPVEAKPAPKVDTKPRAETKAAPRIQREPPAKKSRASAPVRKTLPSCAVVKREYATMSWAQQMAAYRRATPEQIAFGKRCLGF